MTGVMEKVGAEVKPEWICWGSDPLTYLWLLLVETLHSWAWNICVQVPCTLHVLHSLWQRDVYLFQVALLETAADCITQSSLLLLGPPPPRHTTTPFGLSFNLHVDLHHLRELTLRLQQLVLVIMILFPMKEMPPFRLT